MKQLVLTLLILSCVSTVSAQWQEEWTSPPVANGVVAGWLPFEQTGSEWQYRYYVIDGTAMTIMTSAESQTPQYSYSFTAAEQLAGNYIYSIGADLTGDGVTEFYVLAYSGTTEPYRQSFKIFDIVDETILFERDNGGVYYGEPTIWDVDNDGILECTYVRSDYPALTTYSLEVFGTGVASGMTDPAPVPLNVKLGTNYPNPFNPSTTIEFEVKQSGRVRLEIHNALGRSIKTLVDESFSPGNHSIVWNGSDEQGRRQASGSYFYTVSINGHQTQTHRMVLLR